MFLCIFAFHLPVNLLLIVEFALRLIGGKNQREGLVEVAMGSQWGTICTTDFDIKAAHVICRQLGLSYAVTILLAKDFIEDMGQEQTGPVHFCNLSCEGNEENVERCRFTKVSSKYPHTNDISVICSDRGTPAGEDSYQFYLFTEASPSVKCSNEAEQVIKNHENVLFFNLS